MSDRRSGSSTGDAPSFATAPGRTPSTVLATPLVAAEAPEASPGDMKDDVIAQSRDLPRDEAGPRSPRHGRWIAAEPAPVGSDYEPELTVGLEPEVDERDVMACPIAFAHGDQSAPRTGALADGRDLHGYPDDRRWLWALERILDARQETGELLVFAVGVNAQLGDESVERGEPGVRAHAARR